MGTHRTVASFLVLRPSPSHAVSWVESRRVDTRRAVFPSSQPRRAINEAPEDVGATSSTSGVRTETTRHGTTAPSRAEEGASQPRSELTHPELAPADSRAEVNHAGPPVEPPQGPNAQRAVWGPDDPRNIRTLPPLPGPAETTPGARPGTVVAATVCFALAAVSAAVALAWAWWCSINMTTFPTATRLMRWTDPRPGSLASVLWATAMVLIGVVMTAMPALLAVNGWLGHRWVRWGAIGGLAAASLAVTLNTVAWASAPFAVAGLVLVWLPVSRRWLDLSTAQQRSAPR